MTNQPWDASLPSDPQLDRFSPPTYPAAMAKPSVDAGGGLPALLYLLRKARTAGGLLPLYRRLRSRNACKTCALGMGGQKGGMVNEAGHFPEVCKKSVQAQAGDMGRVVSERTLSQHPRERLQTMTPRELEELGRVVFPLRMDQGDRTFRRISWDEALDVAAASLRAAAPERVFFYSSGRSSNEAAFLLQTVARAYGTANIHNCSSYCHSASGVALSKVYGSGTASVVLEDLAQADLALVAGANPASNHPRLITQLMNLRRRGGRVLVVNPLRELGLVRFRIPSDWRSMLFGSQISDLYVQPHIGGDVAVFKALLKGVVQENGAENDYITRFTEGWPGVHRDLESASWDDLREASGLSAEEIEQAVRMLLQAKRGIFLWAMGLTHHENGVDNILALSNLALSRGWLGRPGTGLLPIRGHSNVQGVGSVGVSPGLKRAFADKLRELYGIETPSARGLDTYGCMEAAERGEIDSAILLGGNLFASNPDRAWAGDALRRIGTTTYITTKLNEGHIHGAGRINLVLPVLARDEESQATTQESMFNFIRISDGGEPAVRGELRSEVDVIAGLAERTLPPGRFDWTQMRSHRELRKHIAASVPGYGELEQVDHGRREFQLEGRTFHEPRFATATGKAQFHVTPLTGKGLEHDELRMMTLRSEGQFNTVVYEEEDLYRGNTHRNVIMMAEADARRRGLKETDWVRVYNGTGSMEVRVAIVDIRAGNTAMYYPEANALVPRAVDSQSGTPAFKSVRVRVEPLQPARSSSERSKRSVADTIVSTE